MYDIDKDYDLWLEEQASLLRDRRFEELDILNLVKELEALVRGEKAAIESLTYQIILHKLLIDYWYEEAEWNRNHWRAEIVNFQFQLHNKMTTNLNKHLISRIEQIYLKAKKGAESKTGLKSRFPESLPYSLLEIIGEE